MKPFQIVPLLITVAALLTGFRKNNDTNNCSLATPAEVNIADVKVVEGNAGLKRVQVIVTISGERSGPVSVKYSTRDGTASSTAGSDYITASGSVSFAQNEFIKRIVIAVNGDVAVETDETFEIILSSSSGASLARETGKVIIINDDFSGNSVPASILGSSAGTGGNLISNISVYEVRFTYTGYTAHSATDCGARSNGVVVLTGLIAGPENVEDDDDFMYTGVLQMDMDIDMCSIMRLPSGQDKICAITVIGSGPVDAELEVQSDARGGYMKIEHTSGLFLKNLFGSCDNAQINEEKDMVPDKTIASIFNGVELPMLTNRTLQVGKYVTTGDVGEIVVEVLRKIR